jgi:hypothetical protein
MGRKMIDMSESGEGVTGWKTAELQGFFMNIEKFATLDPASAQAVRT